MSFKKWVFDEIKDHATEDAKKDILSKEDEVYTAADRKDMASALRLAQKWCHNAMAKLAAVPKKAPGKGKDPDLTTTLVQRWFADQDTTAEQVEALVAALHTGFKDIAHACNRSVIFSDEPEDRNKIYNAATGKTGWKDWAFVRSGIDRTNLKHMCVVYLQEAWLDKARANRGKKSLDVAGKLFRCTKTVIHELSHIIVGTGDHRYGWAGLKPDKHHFPRAKAITNADSWAWFAVDLAGHVTKDLRKAVLGGTAHADN
jgi:hypothetical protein